MSKGIYRASKQEAVAFGLPWATVLAPEIARFGASRIFVLASRSLAGKAGLEAAAKQAFGDRLAGFATGIGAHSPREDVLAAATQARGAGADFIVAIGGGSVIDAAKAVQLCLAADVRTPEQLSALSYTRQPSLPPTLPVRMAAVPTTLSGAEFTPFAGVTDVSRGVKEAYVHPLMAPRLVALDPALAVHTPAELWLSTGIRAVDHAVEGLCSPGAQPLSDAASTEALRLLVPSLRRTHADPADLAARLDSLCGVWLATIGLQGGVAMGASHGIGHALGAVARVPHGVTSCIMLPWVLRWNKAVNAARQQAVAVALGDAAGDAGDLVAALVAGLGLPGRLRDAGVDRAQFAAIAAHALHDPWTAANPRPVEGVESVLALLDQAW